MSDSSKIDLRDLFALKSDLLISADLVRNKSVKGLLVEHAGLISRLIAERVSDRAATQPAAGDPIQVEAVAVTREDEDGLYLDWMLEGGISALEAQGVVLLVAHGEVTDNQGSGEVYLAPPAAAHGAEVVPNLVPGLQWAIDYCDAMLRQGNDRMLVEAIRTRLENVLGNQPATMRAQAGEVTGNSRLPAQAGEGGEAVRKDAERYRWLRSRARTSDTDEHGIFVGVDNVHFPGRWALMDEEADRVIDAAMRAQVGEGEDHA